MPDVGIFHLAIPCENLDASQEFYVQRLGCRLARRYADRITLDFFGHQVVCHLAPDKVDLAPSMYPRHFGMTLRQKDDFESLLSRARAHGAKFFKETFTRFQGAREEHQTFFLVDPSNNLLEFKHYACEEMMY